MGAGKGRHKYSHGARGSARAGRGEMAPRDAWRIDLPLGPSRRIAAWVTAIGGTAVAALWLAGGERGLPWPVAAGLSLAIVGLAVRALRRDAFREGPGGTSRLVTGLDGRVEVTTAGGQVRTGRLAGPHFVAPWLVIVAWVPEGARWSRTLLVPSDAAPEGEHRRLRVLLRWGQVRHRT
jgi:hypothetical protein